MLKKSLGDRLNGLSNSAKWTAAFAFIAVISMVVIGFGTSYATPEEATPLSGPPTVITTDPLGELIAPNNVQFAVPDMTANGRTIRLYCLEPHVAYCHDEEHVQGDVNPNYGLNFLLRNGHRGVSSATVAEQEAIWVTQVAIWLHYDPANFITPTRTQEAVDRSREYRPDLWARVDALVAAAANATRPTSTLTFDAPVMERHGNYYISRPLSVVGLPTEIFMGYYLFFDGAPNGTVFIDAQGNPAGASGYLGDVTRIRVPAASVAASGSHFTIRVRGYFEQFTAWNYSAGAGCQRVVLVAPEEETLTVERPVTLIPDTFAGTDAVIWVMGVIILLSGAGIIYANIKPKKQEQ